VPAPHTPTLAAQRLDPAAAATPATAADSVSRLLPLLAAGAVFGWWLLHEGGYPASTRAAGAVVLVGTLAVVTLRSGLRLGREERIAASLLTAFSVWSFASIAWAGSKGDAWDGANQVLLAAVVYVLFAGLQWHVHTAKTAVTTFAVAAPVLGLAVLAVERANAFDGQRLAFPVGYANANAALFLVAFWPAIALASQRAIGRVRRGCLLAASGVSLQLALLAQSRGALAAGAAVTVLLVALVRERTLAVAALLAAGVTTAAALPALLAVYRAAPEGVGRALTEAQLAIGISALVLFAAGLLVPAERLPRRTVFVVAAIALVVAIFGAGSLASESGSTPRSRYSAGVESGRYDLWRVALDEVRTHPVGGLGADNFAAAYARKGRHGEQPLYAHSVLLDVASGTGLVGLGLLAGALAAGFAAALRGIRRAGGAERAVRAGLVAATGFWLIHALVDWTWAVPVVTLPALAALGLSAALSRPRASRPLRSLAAVPVAVVAAVSFGLPGLAAWELERAVESPTLGAAHRHLDRARLLNPLSERADVVDGVLTAPTDPAAARGAFLRALSRRPDDWYAELRLAALTPDAATAGPLLQRAAQLAPNERLVELITAGQRPSRPVLRDLDDEALATPLGRRPLTCRPPVGMGVRCGG